jgi:hypothetical protein
MVTGFKRSQRALYATQKADEISGFQFFSSRAFHAVTIGNTIAFGRSFGLSAKYLMRTAAVSNASFSDGCKSIPAP